MQTGGISGIFRVASTKTPEEILTSISERGGAKLFTIGMEEAVTSMTSAITVESEGGAGFNQFFSTDPERHKGETRLISLSRK